MSKEKNISEKKHVLIAHNEKIYIENGQLYSQGKLCDDIDVTDDIEEQAKLLSRKYYNIYFKARFENLSILTGAGSSIGVGKGAKTGKTRFGLWEAIEKELTKENFEKFCKEVKCSWDEFSKTQDIEALLTTAYKVKDFLADEFISDSIKKIEKVIRECCKLELPQDSPHVKLIKKITARKISDPRVKIITLNYDTLFEQAAQSISCNIIDGFSFIEPRQFNGSNFDYDLVIREGSRVKEEDNYVPNVIHIYKPHGSMDWEYKNGQIIKNVETENPLIIYPKESKYESSYEQPFFEMMLRFQQEVRKRNALLIVIGFSFYDKHISSIIIEALDVNPGLRCVIVTKNIETEEIKKLHIKAETSHNLILIDEEFKDFVINYPFPHTYLDSEINKGSIDV